MRMLFIEYPQEMLPFLFLKPDIKQYIIVFIANNNNKKFCKTKE